MMYPIFIITIFICAVFFVDYGFTTGIGLPIGIKVSRSTFAVGIKVNRSWMSSQIHWVQLPDVVRCVGNPGSTSCSFSSVCFYALVRTEYSITSVLVQQIIFFTTHQHHDTNDALSILITSNYDILVYIYINILQIQFATHLFWGDSLRKSPRLQGFIAVLTGKEVKVEPMERLIKSLGFETSGGNLARFFRGWPCYPTNEG